MPVSMRQLILDPPRVYLVIHNIFLTIPSAALRAAIIADNVQMTEQVTTSSIDDTP